MKTAFACWDNRIAPVFDTAQQILVVTVESGRIVHETFEPLSVTQPIQLPLRLVELSISTLICGAISRPIQGLVIAYGIRVIPFVAGDLREVLQAWLSGALLSNTFAMPGCCRHERRHGMRGLKREETGMNGKGRGGSGRGLNAGSGQGRGRKGGPLAAGTGGNCVCPKCGHTAAHERGLPCNERKCPACGTAMNRQ